MLMSIFKKNSSFFDNYFEIYDKKGVKIKLSFAIIVLVLINSFIDPVTYSYLDQIKNLYILQGFDIIYEYLIPLCSLFIVFYTFFNDYKDRIYELIQFYNKGNYNYIIIFKFFIPVGIILTGSFISGLIYYRQVSFLDLTNIYLSIRFLPNIIFICSMFLFITVLTKNSYAGILTTTTYIIIDFLTSGHLFKIFSMGANMYNFYYCISPSYYIINRVLLIILSVFFLYKSFKNN